MKYLKKFNTAEELETFYDSKMALPSVFLVKTDNNVIFYGRPLRYADFEVSDDASKIAFSNLTNISSLIDENGVELLPFKPVNVSEITITKNDFFFFDNNNGMLYDSAGLNADYDVCEYITTISCNEPILDSDYIAFCESGMSYGPYAYFDYMKITDAINDGMIYRVDDKTVRLLENFYDVGKYSRNTCYCIFSIPTNVDIYSLDEIEQVEYIKDTKLSFQGIKMIKPQIKCDRNNCTVSFESNGNISNFQCNQCSLPVVDEMNSTFFIYELEDGEEIGENDVIVVYSPELGFEVLGEYDIYPCMGKQAYFIMPPYDYDNRLFTAGGTHLTFAVIDKSQRKVKSGNIKILFNSYPYLIQNNGTHRIKFATASPTRVVPNMFGHGLVSVNDAVLEYVKNLPYACFAYTSINEITLPKTLKKIDSMCFYQSSLLTVTSLAIEAPELGDNVFPSYASPTSMTIYYPKGSDYSKWRNKKELENATFIEI